MRSKVILCLIAVLCFLSGSIHRAGALTASDASFQGAGVTIDLEFPEEAHPLETITHNLTITAVTSLVLENFTLVIEALVNMSWQQVYMEQVFLQSMQQSDVLERSTKFTLPQNTNGTLYCRMYVLTDKVSGEPSTYIFYTTHVRMMTYDELLSGYNELLANYSSLQTDYETLLESYSTLSAQYGGLNSTYNSLQATFESLNSSYLIQKADYDALEDSYTSLEVNYRILNQTYYTLKAENDDLRNAASAPNAELTMTRSIVYVLIAVTVVLVVLVIYIRKKKSEPYIVLRKETVALKPSE